MIRPNFDKALKLGELGETQVKAMLESWGWIIYRPETIGSHQMDILAIKDKKTTIAADVKTKDARIYYPDTGVNESHFQLYQDFMVRHNVEFFIFFVDPTAKKIYGNSIEELEKPRWEQGIDYPLVAPVKRGPDKGTLIRYWPLSRMRDFAEISEEQAAKIKELQQRNYGGPIPQPQMFLDFNSHEAA
jgi:hypothetical protein